MTIRRLFQWMFLMIAGSSAFAVGNPVSYVDLSPRDAHKIVLRVDGKPYFATSVSVRLDKLRYMWGWDAPARDAIMKQVAKDGFNTVAIVIHWREVEPSKDRFDWTILDEYMGLCEKYGLKMEMLWLSWSSGGRIQWLDEKKKLLRTPDYVCTPQGTSEFTVLRTTDPWTLDWYDENLRERETYVLGKVMEHIAEWDADKGNPHTLVGVQLGNEPLGYEQNVTAEQIINYYHHVGAAVKESAYSVWTRVNCVNGQCNNRIDANEALRASGGTNIDFVGIDVYGTNPLKISQIMPYTGKNYRMIMESGAEVSQAAVYQMAALYGNTAYVHYEMCGPDGHGLYNRSGSMGFTPMGHTPDVRVMNKLMKDNMTDLAVNSMGYGLYVHNMQGNSMSETTSEEGITFKPKVTSSQAVSIRRSSTETVLLNTKGGTFTFPESLRVMAASKGYFNADNEWVDEGAVSFTNTSITPPVATTVRLVHPGEEEKKPEAVLQAEFAGFGNRAEVSTAYSGATGFACHGYVRTQENGYIEWKDADGLKDGKVVLGFRYATSKSADAIIQLTINGKEQTVVFPTSGGLGLFKIFMLPVRLEAGLQNTIRLSAIGTKMYVDELQIYEDDGSFTGIDGGLSESFSSGMSVYPNPVEDVLYFTNTASETVEAFIYDMSGRMIGREMIHERRINVSGLHRGYYLLRVGDESAIFYKK